MSTRPAGRTTKLKRIRTGLRQSWTLRLDSCKTKAFVVTAISRTLPALMLLGTMEDKSVRFITLIKADRIPWGDAGVEQNSAESLEEKAIQGDAFEQHPSESWRKLLTRSGSRQIERAALDLDSDAVANSIF